MLTIVIPTRDRFPFLIRLLDYWASQGCPYPLLIGDSSGDDHWQRTAESIRAFQGSLRIEHQRFPSYRDLPPGEGMIQCMKGLLKQVKTRYTVLVADDDFVVPGALREALDFLEKHPDYSSVLGEAGFLTVDGEAHGEILQVWRYPQFTIDQPTARERLFTYLEQTITTEYSLKRTGQARTQWEAASELQMDNRFGELLVGGMGVIQGKVKKLDRLFLFRQSHQGMTSRQNASEADFEAITNPQFPLRYQRFRDRLVEELVREDGISPEQAREAVKEGFWLHLVPGFVRKCPPLNRLLYEHFFGTKRTGLLVSLRKRMRKIPALRAVWQRGRLLLPRNPLEVSLPALLQPSSRYHADFLPIYRSIQEPADWSLRRHPEREVVGA